MTGEPPLRGEVALTRGGKTIMGTLITGDGLVSISIDLAEGFGSIGPVSAGDPVVVAWEGGERVARFDRVAKIESGVVLIYLVWGDDLDGLDEQARRARETVGLWSSVRRDALRVAAMEEGVTALAERLGVSRTAIYRAINDNYGR